MNKETTKRRLRGTAAACTVLLAGGLLGVTSTGTAHADSTGAVQTLDHVLIECSDTSTAQAAWTLFTSQQGFAMPVAWNFANFGPFTSGGVFVGGINLEFGVFNQSYFPAGSPTIQAPPAGTCRYMGLAFEPGNQSLSQAENALQTSGINYVATPQNESSASPPYNQMLAWTNLYPTGLSAPAVSPNNVWLQISCYNNAWLQSFGVPGVTDEDSLRAFEQGELNSENGGPLGVTATSSVDYHSNNLSADISGFNQLLAPVTAAGNDTYNFTSGPLFRVVQSNDEGIHQIVLKVSSLSAARSYLTSKGMLGTDNGTSIDIAPSAVGGLSIRLVQPGS